LYFLFIVISYLNIILYFRQIGDNEKSEQLYKKAVNIKPHVSN